MCLEQILYAWIMDGYYNSCSDARCFPSLQILQYSPTQACLSFINALALPTTISLFCKSPPFQPHISHPGFVRLLCFNSRKPKHYPYNEETGQLSSMSESGSPDSFSTKAELIKAGFENLVEASLKKGNTGRNNPSMPKEKPSLCAQNEEGKDRDLSVSSQHDQDGYDTKQWELEEHQEACSIKNTVSLKKEPHYEKRVQNKELNSSAKRKQGWENVARLFGLSSSQWKPERYRHLVLSHNGGMAKSISSMSLNDIKPVDQNVCFPNSAVSTEMKLNISRNKDGDNSRSPQAQTQMQGRRTKKTKKNRKTVDRNMKKWSDQFDNTVERRETWVMNSKGIPMEKADIEQLTDKSVPLNLRIQHLESKLGANLAAIKEERNTLLEDVNKTDEVQDKVIIELASISDALEFCENEIIRTSAELRTTRAQLAALEGKLALDLMKTRKMLDEKDRNLQIAQKVLNKMRPIRIVWPNPASEVLLAGSFNGWATQIKMDQSSAGVFVTSLQLYPGRYEIKFIVDGMWRIDPCRAVVHDNHIENNLLIVKSDKEA